MAAWVLPAISTGISVIGGIAGAKAQGDAQQAQWDAQNARARAEYEAQKAQYEDAKRLQKATDQYARWSAEFNAKLQTVQDQYAYWQQTISYNQQRSFVNAQRNVELINAVKQAKRVRQTRVGATVDYMRQAEALQAGLMQAAMADSLAVHRLNVQAAKAGSEVIASGRSGASIDRLYDDYARQIGDMETAMAINKGFREGQYTREQAGLISQYLTQWRSQEFYEKQRFFDPIRPFPPLPTLITPPPPTSTGPGPVAPVMVGGSSSARNLGMVSSILGGIGAGLNTWQSLNKIAPAPAPTVDPGSGSSLAVAFNPSVNLAPGAFTGSSFAPTNNLSSVNLGSLNTAFQGG